MGETIQTDDICFAVQGQRKGICGSTLKLLAVVTMFLDHFGAAVVWRIYSTNCFAFSRPTLHWLYIAYVVLRMIGRVAFPIYCFLLVEGFEKTRSRAKYALRLFVFALLSEVPFDLAFFGKGLQFGYQNVFFTLLLGFLAMCASRWLAERIPSSFSAVARQLAEVVLTVLCTIPVAYCAELIHTDYGAIGVSCIMALYLTRRGKIRQLIAGIIMFLWEVTAPLAFLAIAFYNGERGKQRKYFFYLFYPVHLLFLYLICVILGIAGQSVI